MYTYALHGILVCIGLIVSILFKVKDLDEITSLDKELHHTILEKNESLNDFRSRLNLRRKVKNRHTFTYPDDDKADNSCDSTTIKAHEEILRNANLLKQEQVLVIQNSSLYLPKPQW